MKQRVDIRKIKVQWLDARCLNLIARYSQLAHQIDDTKISLRSDTCLAEVVEHAKTTQNAPLKAIYQELKAALRHLLTREELQPKLDVLLEYSDKRDNQEGTNSGTFTRTPKN